jgi:tRNA-splicing ligase RtcB
MSDDTRAAPRMIDGAAVFGEHEPGTLAQLRDVASRAERAALMADGHVGYVMPIGGVAAYRDQVSVVGVGFDIACGNAAIRTSLTMRDLGGDAEAQHRTLSAAADEIRHAVSFGVGRKNRAGRRARDHPLFHDDAWSAVPVKERKTLKTKARQQLGTVGSGNHYVDVFADEGGRSGWGCTSGAAASATPSPPAFLALGQNARVGRPRPGARGGCSTSTRRWGTTTSRS